jgi:thymidylate kinase
MSHRGNLIIFEGPDGVGKTTLSKWLAVALQKKGDGAVIWSSFPGNAKDSLGGLVRKLHHDPTSGGVKAIHPLSLQLLHIAAHVDAIESRFLKLLREGGTIILDRFWWSTWVYGRFAGADATSLQMMIEIEKRAWRTIKPSQIFVITRRNSKTSEADIRLEQLYTQLARKEMRLVPVKLVQNNGDLEMAKNQILSSLL